MRSIFTFVGTVTAASTLLSGGTIIAFNDETNTLNIIRNGSILIQDDRIISVNTSPLPDNFATNSTTTTIIDVTDQIITPGFVDTHRHGWQTAFKTIGSNTTLAEYFGRYSPDASAPRFTAEDVYLSQRTSLYESLNGGVTTILDHAHHAWSRASAHAGLNASIDSRARVFWAYAFQNYTSVNYTLEQQIPNFREIAESAPFANSPTELGVAYDSFGPTPGSETEQVMALAREYNVSVLTTHSLAGPWGVTNLPSEVHAFNMLNTSIPVVFSHASFITANEASLLRQTDQYISITPESEMHYGHTHPHARMIQDQSSLGVDTHFTFSADILTQARLWLQRVRYDYANEDLERWEIPSKNAMSATQAFLLATRSGGQALRRDDIGVIKPGAKADIVVWNAKDSVSMLGWVDPVAAVMLHANPGDVLHVMVDGHLLKKDGKLTDPDYEDVKSRFLQSARKIQKIWRETPYPVLEGQYPMNGIPYAEGRIADVQSGSGTGYGQLWLE